MDTCAFAKVCLRRMRDGDHPQPGGCDKLAELICDPDPRVDLLATIPARHYALRVAVLRWERPDLRNSKFLLRGN